MKRLYLQELEDNQILRGPLGRKIQTMQQMHVEIPQIYRLFAYKPQMAKHIGELTEDIMRGPSPLSAGMRELIAALVSSRNGCHF